MQQSGTLPQRASGADGGLVLTEEFSRALEILAAGDNLFLTGKAGTGKSTLIRHFMAGTERRVVVAAPTGIAALNVDGYTIHRLFGFAPTTTLADVRGGSYYPRRFARTLQALDTLIIDEASMVRADLFDMLVAALERFGPMPHRPFGGVQLVLVGDLFQLPPVVPAAEAEYFSTHYATPYFFSADHFERADFPTVALTTVFRQQGDQRLTALLTLVDPGERIVLVEDLSTDGRSKIRFCEALRTAGLTVEHTFVIFHYDIFPESRQTLQEFGLTNINQLPKLSKVVINCLKPWPSTPPRTLAAGTWKPSKPISYSFMPR